MDVSTEGFAEKTQQQQPQIDYYVISLKTNEKRMKKAA
jgi:hypothetical protein